MNVTKAHLVDMLVGNTVATKSEANELVNAFFEEIVVALENGGDLKLSGFGHFKVRDKRARPGRNPKTGKEAVVPERRVVCFYPSPKLKEIVARATRHEHGANKATEARRDEAMMES